VALASVLKSLLNRVLKGLKVHVLHLNSRKNGSGENEKPVKTILDSTFFALAAICETFGGWWPLHPSLRVATPRIVLRKDTGLLNRVLKGLKVHVLHLNSRKNGSGENEKPNMDGRMHRG
jgi:hypothetical protein